MTAAVLDRVQRDVFDVTPESAEPPQSPIRPVDPITADAAVAQAPVPQPAVAQAPVAQAPVPQPAVAQAPVPQPAVAQAPVPQPAVPQPPVPQPAVAQALGRAVPDAEIEPDDEETEAETPSARLDTLVRAALAGEPRAHEDLLAEIHPFVLRYCRGRLGRQETVAASAEDVAQEVCLAVISALPAYTLRGLSFRAFVYGIAAHKVTDAFRAIGRSRTEPVSDLPDSPSTEDGPEHRLLSVELSAHLERLLEVLTPRQRDVLVLRIMVGLSAEETAAIVRSTPGAVRVTQHRALNRLRVMLEGGAPGLVAPSAGRVSAVAP